MSLEQRVVEQNQTILLEAFKLIRKLLANKDDLVQTFVGKSAVELFNFLKFIIDDENQYNKNLEEQFFRSLTMVSSNYFNALLDVVNNALEKFKNTPNDESREYLQATASLLFRYHIMMASNEEEEYLFEGIENVETFFEDLYHANNSIKKEIEALAIKNNLNFVDFQQSVEQRTVHLQFQKIDLTHKKIRSDFGNYEFAFAYSNLCNARLGEFLDGNLEGAILDNVEFFASCYNVWDISNAKSAEKMKLSPQSDEGYVRGLEETCLNALKEVEELKYRIKQLELQNLTHQNNSNNQKSTSNYAETKVNNGAHFQSASTGESKLSTTEIQSDDFGSDYFESTQSNSQ